MSSSSPAGSNAASGPGSNTGSETFPIRPLIRRSILALYGTLVLPLLAMAWTQMRDPSWLGGLAAAVLLGGIFLGIPLSQRIVLDREGMHSTYPAWVPHGLRQPWTVRWADVVDIEAATTGQGGLVYYLVTATGSRILVPLRVQHLPRLLSRIERYTGIPTQEMRPYVQTWMYGGLSGAAAVMALVDVWLGSLLVSLG